MTAYYNEFDPKAAAWLRMLIQDGLIAPGDVDERSIVDVKPDDLKNYTQHHFFAGIGVWSYALRNAGWSDNIRVCTASLPCQPFSAAGKQLGKADERHLLPHFLNLVRECGFNTIFGEQVESAIRHGWLDDLQTNMEAEGYAVGHCVLGAHSAGSFHQRQRLYWVAHRLADTINTGPQGRLPGGQDPQRQNIDGHAGRGSTDSRFSLGNAKHNGQPASEIAGGNDSTILGSKKGQNSACESERAGASRIISGEFGGMGNSESERPKGFASTVGKPQGAAGGYGDGDSSIEWLYCRDEKYRAIKSGLSPLVDGTAEGVGYSGDPSQPFDADYSAEARVMRLKGYGNAIHAGTAEIFIRAFMECQS